MGEAAGIGAGSWAKAFEFARANAKAISEVIVDIVRAAEGR
jgi:hypothetical protein